MTGSVLDRTAIQRRRRGRWWRWLKIGMVGLLAIVVFLLIAGMIYQVVGAANDARRFPPPGQLVDVGGHKLHIYCVGEGSPTVILDHVADTNAAQWALIQPAVASETRVCAYDRAGFGWSDAGPLPRDGRQNADELHTLLENAGVPGPYVLVGHSYGANVVRIYAAQHPDDVAGLVLVDPGFVFDRPGVPTDINEQAEGIVMQGASFIMRAGPLLTRVGLMRLGAAFGALGYGDLPWEQGEAFVALQLTTKFRSALLDQDLRATSPQVLAAEQQLPAVPLLVLSAEEPRDDRFRQVYTDVNAGIAALVPGGMHQVVPGSNHMSLALDREHARVTSAAILEVVAAVRTD